MQRLHRDDLYQDKVLAQRLIGASAPEKTGIVHIGLGNFHRAHAAVATAEALAAEPGDWGVVGVAMHSHGVVDPMREQGGAYSVLQLTPRGEDVGIVDVHRAFCVAADEPEAVVAQIAAPEHKIVTLTVSEQGYHKDEMTGGLDTAHPDVAADIAGAGPSTPVGLLARGLQKRFADGGAPLTILCCDNMQAGGALVRRLVTEFLQAVDAESALLDWMAHSVTFPNSMVDRIVPGTTDKTRADVERIAGYHDDVPVPTEEFTMWVIEDNFAAGRPAWEKARGVIFSTEVEKYELVKLRILNACHSLISYLGVLDGRGTVPDARTQQFIEDCVRHLIGDEMLPSIDLPEGFDPENYVAQLFDRWTNFALGDRTARICSHGIVRLNQRVIIPGTRLLAQGIMPQQIALLFASWLCCTCPPPGFVPDALVEEIVEPRQPELRAASDAALAAAGPDANPVAVHVDAILRGGFFASELTAYEAFNQRVTELVQLIVSSGVRAAAQDALSKRLSSI
ncbi:MULTISPECIES: mannitol dehydrogenase family protein [unclassified Actinobaculum]|uniref:mannitol dehydrogenase family protein n=1 Tax=unclassified Actinobaculum TaxID=2609299 RepID=UPI000D52849A|nr:MULTISPECIES: mannitol dehydrogenase family protein [unclassified Actinobaculum]AWE43229.1 fructuronate reductase [Actinobaculum sp. 313]RTE49872.1 mannitol dehydrogenase family protein [Actinobaculum sp. 352]